MGIHTSFEGKEVAQHLAPQHGQWLGVQYNIAAGGLASGRALSITSDLGSGSEDAADGVLPADTLDQVQTATATIRNTSAENIIARYVLQDAKKLAAGCHHSTLLITCLERLLSMLCVTSDYKHTGSSPVGPACNM